MQIYHNPRCSKSRQTLKLIQDSGIEPEIIEYLKTPPTEDELGRILTLLKLSPAEITRRKEAEYKELEIADQNLTREAYIKILVENPKLIERPIVVADEQAVIGRPPENVNSLL